MPGEVRLALCSTFTPSSSAIIRGLSLCRSQPDLRIFLRVLWFSSLSKIRLSVKNICRLGTVLLDHAWPFDDSLRRLFICIRLVLDWVKSINSPVGTYGRERVKTDKWFSHWLPLCRLKLKNEFIQFTLSRFVHQWHHRRSFFQTSGNLPKLLRCLGKDPSEN